MFSKQTKSTLIGSGSVFVWSTAALIAAKLQQIPTFQILTFSFAIGFIVTALKLTIKKQWYLVKQPLIVWLIGIIGVYGNNALYVEAFKHAPAAHIDLINYLWPIFAALLSTVLPSHAFSYRFLIACLIGFAGSYVMITNGQSVQHFNIEHLPGYGLALLGSIAWAIYSLMANRYKSPVEMVGMYCGIGAVASFFLHSTFERTVIPEPSQLFFMGMMGAIVVAYFLWDHGVKHGNFKLLSIFSYCTPILSINVLILFKMAEPSIALLVAVFLVIGAALYANWQPKKRRNYLPSSSLRGRDSNRSNLDRSWIAALITFARNDGPGGRRMTSEEN